MKKFWMPCLLMLALFTMAIGLSGCSADSVIDSIKKILGKKPGTAQPPTPEPQPAPAPTPGPATGTADAPNGGDPGADNACVVTVYGNDSCPYCVKAKAYLKSKGVAFVDKNVSTDQAAKQELSEKAQKQGMKVSGIPVIDVCGDMMTGFSEAKLEALLKKHGLLGDGAPAADPPAADQGTTNACTVTVYGTSSCSWCKKAKSYLQSKGVPFNDKDVGRDQAANREMFEKAKAKGLSPRGVPVIDVCGDMILGFNQSKLDQLLQKHGFTGGAARGANTENPGN